MKAAMIGELVGGLAGARGYASAGALLQRLIHEGPISRRPTLHKAATSAAEFAGFKACFSAGTPIRTPLGTCLIEDIRVGDMVLSRDESNPDGLVVVQRVEEVFEHNGLIWELRIAGRVIRSTAEHPFYQDAAGWVPLHALQVGDRIALRIQRENKSG